jgi:Ni/Co efflux regulator RcnB
VVVNRARGQWTCADPPAVDKDIAMTNSKLLCTAALLLAGAFAAPAMAQDARYAYPDPLYANGDADGDSIPNADDPVDNRYDEAGNPVRFEVGESLPADSYGSETLVDGKLYGLHAPGSGQAWHRLGNNFYLIETGNGRVDDAVYNLPAR